MTLCFLLTLFKVMHCFSEKTKHFPLFWVVAFQLCWKTVMFARLVCFLLPTSSWQCLNDYWDRHVPGLPCKLRFIRRQKQDWYFMSSLRWVFLSSSYTKFNGTSCLHAYIRVLAAEAKEQKKVSYFNSVFSEDLDACLIWYLELAPV